MSFPQQRPRRMRRTPALRALIRETELAPRQLIAPLFVKEGIADAVPSRRCRASSSTRSNRSARKPSTSRRAG
jgi:delta-aminolevulinic acid dehydratase/porphobilinogen synthase